MNQANSKFVELHKGPSAKGQSRVMRRRDLLGNLVLGGAATLMLSACGGGSSDSSDDSRDLVAAYNRLKDGMTWDEAKAAVGWEPNDSDRSWSNSGYLLKCSIVYKTGSSIQFLDHASLSGNGVSVSHVFLLNSFALV